MGLAPTIRTAHTNLGTKCAVSAVPRRSRQKTSKTTTSRTPSKIAISTTDAASPSTSGTLRSLPGRVLLPPFADEEPGALVFPGAAVRPRHVDALSLLP